MNVEQRNAILDRLMHQRRENQARAERLHAECLRIGKRLADIAGGLMHHPAGVALDEQVIDPRFGHHRVNLLRDDFDVESLVKVLDLYRQALIRKDTLDIQLKELGVVE